LRKEICFKVLDKDLIPPEVIDIGDWIDLRVSSIEKGYMCKNTGEIIFKPLVNTGQYWYYYPNDYLRIRLGIAVQLPEGSEAHVVPRSSTFKNYGFLLTNSMGIIDNTYCGEGDEWLFPVIAMRDGRVAKNDRVCQFRVTSTMRSEGFVLKQVDSLSGKNRGGHGSTGVK